MNSASVRKVLPMKLGAAAMTVCAVCAACGAPFEKVPDADVDGQQKATAQAIAVRIYEGCRTGTHEPLREDEAIPEMRDALAPAKLVTTCATLKSKFGDYQSLDFAEAWKPRSGALVVYRFKGHFSNTSETPEIRVVMDRSKLSGFWLKPWSDALR